MNEVVGTEPKKTELEEKIILLERLREIVSKEEVIMNVHEDGGVRYIWKKDITFIFEGISRQIKELEDEVEINGG